MARDRERAEMAGAALPVGIHGLTLDRFVHDGRSRSTWCAFESIGIPAALRLDATTHTDCPTGRRAVRVGIVGGTPDDGNIALWLPDPTDGLHQHIDVAPSAGHHRRSRERSELGRDVWADVVGVTLEQMEPG